MDFHPQEPFDSNVSHKHLWNSLRQAFQHEPGVAYYRYPIFARDGRRRREPDFLLLHRQLGVWVIQCEGFSAGNIPANEDNRWRMQDWREDVETPLLDAEEQVYAVKHHHESWRHTRDLLVFRSCVALPNITRTEWEEKGFDRLTSGSLIFRQELGPVRIKAALERIALELPQKTLTDEQWEWVVGLLGGQIPDPLPRPVPTNTPPDSPIRVIRDIETRLKSLDGEQQKGAFQIPNGPQRLRGLAGTGKTVLLAKRAAKIHARHPDWRIAFVFFTKSLYDQVRGLVEVFYREMTGEAPDWQKVEVLHAWDGGKQRGFYSTLAGACGVRPLTADEAWRKTGSSNPDVRFAYICVELEKTAVRMPPLYDAILIDEGQDLPPPFYRLALMSLKEPKRLYWAYDEAQGIGSLLVPRPSLVFGERDGQATVDLSGKYEGGIEKSHLFKRCYRTPELLLMTAHAINMGLLRKGGVLQGLTTQEDWSQLGYEVEGNFQKAGEPVRLRRHPDARTHPLDVDEDLRRRAGPPLVFQTFADESMERQWVAERVAEDIRKGLQPTDILVTALVGEDEKKYFERLEASLRQRGVRCWRPGKDWKSKDFRLDGHVTLANIFQAKGNEAWKVYAARFHYATKPIAWRGEQELHKRNQAFVALTRARIWCVVTGLGSPIFEELQTAIGQAPELVFPAFNRRSLNRIIDESTSEQRVESEAV
jgi:superfamily I DNA and RNA helicase